MRSRVRRCSGNLPGTTRPSVPGTAPAHGRGRKPCGGCIQPPFRKNFRPLPRSERRSRSRTTRSPRPCHARGMTYVRGHSSGSAPVAHRLLLLTPIARQRLPELEQVLGRNLATCGPRCRDDLYVIFRGDRMTVEPVAHSRLPLSDCSGKVGCGTPDRDEGALVHAIQYELLPGAGQHPLY